MSGVPAQHPALEADGGSKAQLVPHWTVLLVQVMSGASVLTSVTSCVQLLWLPQQSVTSHGPPQIFTQVLLESKMGFCIW